MDKIAAFQYGYLSKCAEHGIHPKAAIQLCKQGFSIGGALDMTGKALSALGPLAIAVPPALAALGGIGTAALHHKFTDRNEEDVKIEEMRIRANAMQRESDRIRRRLREGFKDVGAV